MYRRVSMASSKKNHTLSLQHEGGISTSVYIVKIKAENSAKFKKKSRNLVAENKAEVMLRKL